MTDVFANHSQLAQSDITGITLLLFVGATGKSAQIPLYTWLPDAMAGPTPVSALIHAATMVTAGIYMIARSNILYTLAPVTQTVVAIIGLATAILAATIALKQNDIKKVLAYSTVSQLGYMFLAWRRCLYRCCISCNDTCIFQSLFVPWCGFCYSCHEWRTGYAQHGRIEKIHAHYTHHFFIGLPCHCRYAAFFGFLFRKMKYLAAAYAEQSHLCIILALPVH